MIIPSGLTAVGVIGTVPSVQLKWGNDSFNGGVLQKLVGGHWVNIAYCSSLSTTSYIDNPIANSTYKFAFGQYSSANFFYTASPSLPVPQESIYIPPASSTPPAPTSLVAIII